MFTQSFDRYVCPGDRITCEVDGFTITAHIVADSETRPDDFDCYSDEDKARWLADEWFYCGVVLSVEREDVMLSENAASVWGVEANIIEGNGWLQETANELLSEALDEGKAVMAKLCASVN